MSSRAWSTFLAILILSALVAILATPELGAAALILAGLGAASAIFGAIQDHKAGR